MRGQRVAVVGSGVSGLVAAHRLAPHHTVTVFEQDERLGGHVQTVPVALGGREYAVDVGFVVFNDRTYPLFAALLRQLGVATRDTEMSFSVRSERDDLEYNGGSLRGLFAQPGNALRPAFVRMLAEIARFNRIVRAFDPASTEPLGELLVRHRFSRVLREWYVLPMIACIWSAPAGDATTFPMGPLATFLRTHGLLDLAGRPQWRVIRGGAARYLEALVAPIRSLVRVGARVREIRRRGDGVEIDTATGSVEAFDRAIVAVHGDQVLPLVADATPAERAAFESFRYVENDVVLHTDDRLLPRRPRARASWNAIVPSSSTEPIRVTYDMTRLQSLDAPKPICVTLNASDGIDPARIVRRFRYRHPLLAPDAAAATARVTALNGADRIHYCGAYLGYEARVDADMNRERRIEFLGEPVDFVADLDRRVDGLLRRVLDRVRDAEEHHQTLADVFVHDAAVGADDALEAGEAVIQRRGDGIGAPAGGEVADAREVGKEHRRLTTFALALHPAQALVGAEQFVDGNRVLAVPELHGGGSGR